MGAGGGAEAGSDSGATRLVECEGLARLAEDLLDHAAPRARAAGRVRRYLDAAWELLLPGGRTEHDLQGQRERL